MAEFATPPVLTEALEMLETTTFAMVSGRHWPFLTFPFSSLVGVLEALAPRMTQILSLSLRTMEVSLVKPIR